MAVDAEENDDEVSVVGFTMTNTVPVPGFIAVALMETYETDPLELCLSVVDAIRSLIRSAVAPQRRHQHDMRPQT